MEERAGFPEVVDSEVGAAWRRETWAIRGSRGDTVLVETWLAAEPEAVVVIGHGAESDRRARFVSGTGKGWARRGISVVAADAPGHGDRASLLPWDSRSPSGGSESTRRIEVEGVSLPGWGGAAGGDYAGWWIDDHRLVVDAAQGRLGTIPVGFLGISMGAVLGVRLVAAEPRIAAAVFAVAGSATVPGAEQAGGGPAMGWANGEGLEEAAARLGDRPVLMVQADEDEVFSREAACALYGMFSGRKEISFFPGSHSVWRYPAQWNRRMLAFFHETLGTGPASAPEAPAGRRS